jgi:hypothetical protein
LQLQFVSALRHVMKAQSEVKVKVPAFSTLRRADMLIVTVQVNLLR